MKHKMNKTQRFGLPRGERWFPSLTIQKRTALAALKLKE
jgi:hypothetical protein